MININYYWQIHKYKDDELPLYQQDKKPIWTSVSDIGNTYNGRILTIKDYLAVENLFVKSIQIFMNCSNSTTLIVKKLEKPLSIEEIEHSLLKKGLYLEGAKEMLKFFQMVEEGMTIGIAEIGLIARLTLREYIWTQLASELMFVRFDYDYFVDIGSVEKCEDAVKQIRKMKLSVNLWNEHYPFADTI